MSARYTLLDHALGAGLLPDRALRFGSRLGIHKRLRAEERGGVEAQEERIQSMVERMSSAPIAELPARANGQHYETPPEFMGAVPGSDASTAVAGGPRASTIWPAPRTRCSH